MPAAPAENLPPPPPAPQAASPDLPGLLAQYRKERDDAQKEVERLEPLKTGVAEKTQRIQALEKILAGQQAAAATYTDFYRGMEVFQRETSSFIDTVRAQLALDPAAKKRLEDAVAAVQKRVDAALAARDAQQQVVARKASDGENAAARLATARRWSDLFGSGLQQQAGRRRDDLKVLRQQATGAKDPAETSFYLSEMEAIIGTPGKAGEAAGYADDLSLRGMLSRWAPDAYAKALRDWTSELDSAAAADRKAQAELADARKQLGDLDKAARDAQARRREWIVKELKRPAQPGA